MISLQSRMFKILVILSAFILINAAAQLDDNLIVELPQGKLRGKDNGFYYSYTSIPYAEPPIGALRFESPKPYTQKWATVFDATQPPAACLQWNQWNKNVDKLNGQEDCLTVNIYKPKSSNNTNLAVLIDIHGGAFMYGSASTWNVNYLMQDAHFIVVKMAYRLGPLGFLSTEDEVLPGNYGLKDQRLAMQWVKQNIEAFGGDAEKIFVLGFSAAGVAVHFHMLQPEFKSIAKAAFSMSGTALTPWSVLKKTRPSAFQMARNLNCTNVETSADIKKCLQAKSAEEIVRDVRNFLVFDYIPFTTFGPVIEPASVKDAFLTRAPEEIIKSGEFAQIPWIISYAANDGAFNAATLMKKAPNGKELIDVLNERWHELAPYMLFYKDTSSSVAAMNAYSTALKKRYLGDKRFSVETYFDVQSMFTDILFRDGAQQAVELHRKFNAPLYAYVYDNPGHPTAPTMADRLAERTDIQFGTVHGDDFSLIMKSEEQDTTSQKYLKMLVDFVYNDELAYDQCKFVNNAGREKLALMFIKGDTCESKDLANFP